MKIPVVRRTLNIQVLFFFDWLLVFCIVMVVKTKQNKTKTRQITTNTNIIPNVNSRNKKQSRLIKTHQIHKQSTNTYKTEEDTKPKEKE